MDLSPLWISLRTAAVSTCLTFIGGIFIAHAITKLGRIPKGVMDGILTLPMILPPTVIGFFLLKLFGINGPIGILWANLFNAKIVFTWQATVLSSTIVSFPLMYRTARGIFEQFDDTLIFSAQTLGLSNTYIFWRVLIPNCSQGILAGTVLAFARSLGEFGATMMLAGNIPGKTTTIATAVYAAISSGNDSLAYKWVLINLLLSFSVLMIMNRIGGNIKKSTKVKPTCTVDPELE